MATNYSPKIVTDGLVLCLDAADKNSYSGSIHGGVLSTWSDLSGQGNNGTISGSTFDTGSGGSINFDGSNDYVELPTSLPDAPTALTVTFWIYPDAWDTGTNGGWILDSGELDVVIGTHADDDYMYFCVIMRNAPLCRRVMPNRMQKIIKGSLLFFMLIQRRLTVKGRFCGSVAFFCFLLSICFEC